MKFFLFNRLLLMFSMGLCRGVDMYKYELKEFIVGNWEEWWVEILKVL